MTVIRHFEDPRVIAGHGTIGLEIMEDCPNVGLVLVPVSSGGLLGGRGGGGEGAAAGGAGVGVQPEGADAMARSLEAGRVVSIPEARTMCDALVATPAGRAAVPSTRGATWSRSSGSPRRRSRRRCGSWPRRRNWWRSPAAPSRRRRCSPDGSERAEEPDGGPGLGRQCVVGAIGRAVRDSGEW